MFYEKRKLMKKVFAILFISLSLIIELQAQCNEPAPPSLTCGEAGQPENVLCTLDGYCSTSNSDPNTQNVPSSFCGSVENNVWLAFVAGSTQLQIGITIEWCNNGDGLQAQIYSDCQGYNPVSNCWNPGNQTNGILTCNNLTIGNTYYLMIDGWAGDYCDFSLEEISGSTSPPEPDNPSQINGPLVVCPGAVVTYCVPSSFGASLYNWEIPNDAFILAGQGTDCITVDWADSDGGEVCVIAANSCNSSDPYCVTVEMGPPPSSTMDVEVCAEDLPYLFNGSPLSVSGQYTAVFSNSLGCDSTVTLNLTVNSPQPTFIEATICEGETYEMGGLSFSQNGIFPLTFQNAQGCDSLVTLTLTVLVSNTIIASPGTISCFLPTVTLDGSFSTVGANVFYFWETLDGLICSDPSLPVVAVCAGGTYTLTVTNAQNGVECVSSASVTVEEDILPPAIETDYPGSINCINDCVTLETSYSDAGNNVIITWAGPDNFFSSELSPTVCLPGNYSITMINMDNGCSGSLSTTVVNDQSYPDANAGADLTLDCANPFVLADGAGSSTGPGFTYSWIAPNGSEVSNQITAELNAPGQYILEVTNTDNGCIDSDTIEVTVDNVLPLANAGPNKTINCYVPAVILNGNGSTNNGNTIFEWSFGGNIIGTSTTVSVNLPGTYTLTVIDTTNGCASSDQVLVIEDIGTPQAQANVSGFLDCITGSVTLDGAGSSSLSGNSGYLWEDINGQLIGSGFSFTVNEPGFFVLNVTDLDNGCEDRDTVEVMIDQNTPFSEPGPDGTLNCVISSWTLTTGNSSIGPGMSYQWQNAAGIPISVDSSIVVTNPGVYTLIVSNSVNGCTSVGTAVVSQDVSLPIAEAGAPMTLSCSDTILALDGTGSSTGGNYLYSWTDEGGSQIGDSLIESANLPGEYQLQVTNTENGCTATDNVLLSQDVNLPSADAGSDEALTCTVQEISLDASASAGGNNLSFFWENSLGEIVGNTPDIVVTIPDTYTVVVTNLDNGCADEDEVWVFLDANFPTADAGQDTILNCAITQVNLDASASSGTGTLAYEWQVVGSPVGSNSILSVSDSGTYLLMVTDLNNGCTATDEVYVAQDTEAPIASAGPTGTLTCTSASVQLDGTGSSVGNNFSYEWLNQGGVTVSNQITADVGETGVYTLIVTNLNNGCSAASQTQVLPDSDLPVAVASVSGVLTCAQTAVDLTSSGSTAGPGIAYFWKDPLGQSQGSGNTIAVNQPGVYSLTVENTTNGCSSSATVAVNQDVTIPGLDAGTTDTITCAAPVLLLDATGNGGNAPLAYSWYDENGDIIANSDTVSVDIPGLYFVNVINNINGCEAVDSVEIAENKFIPEASISSGGVLTCANPTLTIDGTGSADGQGIQFEWYNSNGEIIGTEDTLEVNLADTYSLLVLDLRNGCAAQDQVSITEDKILPVSDAGIPFTLTCRDTAAVIGGSSTSLGVDMAYDWFNANGSNIGDADTLIVTLPDTYTLQVTDIENGCVATSTVVIAQDIVNPPADAGINGVVTCFAPVFTFTANQGDPGSGLSFEWYDAAGQLVENNLSYATSQTGTYQLVVTDNDNGCKASDIATLTANNTPPVPSATPTNILTCSNTFSTLNGGSSYSVNGSSLKYIWKDEQGNTIGQSVNLLVSAPGSYQLEVMDNGNGCLADTLINVFQNIVSPVIDISSPQIINCYQDSVLVDASNSSGNQLSFVWSDINSEELNNLPSFYTGLPGNYVLLLTDGVNGCKALDTITVLQDTHYPTVVTQVSGIIKCNTPSVTLSGSGSSFGQSFSYSWTNQQGDLVGQDLTASAMNPGLYYLAVTNGVNGCVAEGNVQVLIDTISPEIDLFANPSNLLTCDLTETELDGSESSGTGLISYKWEDNNGVSLGSLPWLTVDSPGSYTLIVTSSGNGCSASENIDIQQDIEVPIVNINSPDTLNCQILQVDLDGSSSSAGPEFLYTWSKLGGGIIGAAAMASTDAPGTYQLKVVDQTNGCVAIQSIPVFQNIVQPSAEASVSGILTCEQIVVTLDGAQSSGGSNPAFQWTLDGQVVSTNMITTVNMPGIYELEVTNTDNFCVSNTEISVLQDTVHPIAIANSSGVLTCENTEIILDNNGSSLGNNIQYSWLDVNNSQLGSGANIAVTMPGMYSMVVANIENGCVDTAQISVNQDTISPLAVATADGILTCDNLEVILSNAGSNTGNFEYSWIDTDGLTSIGAGNTVAVTDPGVYYLAVTNNFSGCNTVIDIEVEQDIVNPEANIDLSQSLQITCDHPVVILDGSNSVPIGNLSFNWRKQNQSIGNAAIYEATQPGQYSLLVSNTINGCTDIIEVIVEEDTEIPFVSIAAPAVITCLQESVALDGSNSVSGPNFSYGWSGPLLLGPTNQVTAEAGGSGTYSLLVTNTQTGCSNTAVATVGANQTAPNANAVAGAPIDCFDPETVVRAEGSSTGAQITYDWSTIDGHIIDGAQSFEAAVDESGLYILIVTDTENGCTAEAEVSVIAFTEPPVDALINLRDPSCFGYQNGSIMIEEVFGGSAPYVYSINNSPFVTGNEAFGGLGAGVYELVIQDVYGCEWSTTLNLEQPDELIVDLGDEQFIELGDEALLEVLVNRFNEDLLTVEWLYPEDKFCDSNITRECLIVIDTPFVSTNYLVTITDASGCEASDRVRVHVEKPARVFIPSAFSPDGDGENDYLTVYGGKDVKQIKQFTIMNRWGEEVHRATNFLPGDKNAGWDGLFRGKAENPSVFVAWAEVEFVDGSVAVFTRDVTLIR